MEELAPEIEIENHWHGTDPVRLVHLLEHTAGFDDWHLNELAHNDPKPLPLKDSLELSPSTRRVRWRPGTHFSYSNAGIPVLARIIEKVTGRTLEAQVKLDVFEPLGLNHSTFFLDEGLAESLARGYVPGKEAPVEYWHLHQRPAGALNSTLEEVTRLTQLFLGRGTLDGKLFLSPSTIQRMETPTTSTPAKQGLAFG